jgi:hypothetical protein
MRQIVTQFVQILGVDDMFPKFCKNSFFYRTLVKNELVPKGNYLNSFATVYAAIHIYF